MLENSESGLRVFRIGFKNARQVLHPNQRQVTFKALAGRYIFFREMTSVFSAYCANKLTPSFELLYHSLNDVFFVSGCSDDVVVATLKSLKRICRLIHPALDVEFTSSIIDQTAVVAIANVKPLKNNVRTGGLKISPDITIESTEEFFEYFLTEGWEPRKNKLLRLIKDTDIDLAVDAMPLKSINLSQILKPSGEVKPDTTTSRYWFESINCIPNAWMRIDVCNFGSLINRHGNGNINSIQRFAEKAMEIFQGEIYSRLAAVADKAYILHCEPDDIVILGPREELDELKLIASSAVALYFSRDCRYSISDILPTDTPRSLAIRALNELTLLKREV